MVTSLNINVHIWKANKVYNIFNTKKFPTRPNQSLLLCAPDSTGIRDYASPGSLALSLVNSLTFVFVLRTTQWQPRPQAVTAGSMNSKAQYKASTSAYISLPVSKSKHYVSECHWWDLWVADASLDAESAVCICVSVLPKLFNRNVHWDLKRFGLLPTKKSRQYVKDAGKFTLQKRRRHNSWVFTRDEMRNCSAARGGSHRVVGAPSTHKQASSCFRVVYSDMLLSIFSSL